MSNVRIMIGTMKGAFFLWSDESRTEWKIDGPLLKGWEVLTLTPDRSDSSRILAGLGHEVYGPGLHISEDGGKSWRQMEEGPAYDKNSGFKLNRIWTVIQHPVQDDTFYAGVDEAGLFVSNDRGEHWEEITPLTNHRTRKEWYPGYGGLCLHTVLINRENTDQIWVGISAVGVLRSDDGGNNWHVKNSGLDIITPSKEFENIGSCVHRIVMDGQHSTTLYQQNHQGVFRSRDGADSWERIESGLPSRFGFPMVISQRNGNALFVIPQESDEYRFPKDGNLTVYRSMNGGESWEPLSHGLPSGGFYSGVLRNAMDVDTLSETGIYFGTTGGQILFSRDRGESWNTIPYVLPRILSVTATVVGNS